MAQLTYGVSVAGAGETITKTVVRTGDHLGTYDVSIPAAEQGNLSTRSTDTTGTITMDSGSHSISTSDVIDIFWEESGVKGRRYGVTAGTVSGADIPISGGTGDVLPSAAEVVTVDEQVTINTQIDGDNIKLIAVEADNPDASSGYQAHIDMQDSGSSTIEAITLTANQPRVYDIDGGDTNVFTGNLIDSSKASNGDPNQAITLRIISLEDSTP